MNDTPEKDTSRFRDEAEKKVGKFSGDAPADDQQRTAHELCISQVELAMQKQEFLKVQRQLQQALERCAALYHESPVGYITIDAEGQIHDLNESFAAMVGAPASRLISTDLASHCTTESGNILRQSLPAFFKRPEDKSIELKLTGTHKRPLQVEIKGRRLRDSSLLICTVIDRSACSLAQESLREAEARLHAVTSAARNAILMIDGKGNISFCNPAVEQVLGYTSAEMLGHNLHELLCPERFLDRFHSALPEFQRTGQGAAVGKTLDLKARHKDGREIDIELSLSSVKIKGEWHAVGIIRDLSQRKFREQELQLTRDRLQHWYHLMQYIIHHDPNAIAVLDRNLHFLFVSDRFLQDYNVRKKDIIGKHHYEIFPEIPNKWRSIHQRALQGEVLGSEEDCFVRDDGTSEYTRWCCRPWYDLDGTIGGLILYTEVITARKQMEEALKKRTAELEQRSAELERFNYTVAHDLKSPLVTVRAFLGFLEQDLHDGDSQQTAKDINYIRTAVDRMSTLLDDLLHMSELGWVADPPELLNLNDLLQEVQLILGGQLLERGVDISSTGTDVQLYGERSRLIEIWQNLIGNAVKYMGNQPNPRIHVGIEQQMDEQVFYVRDNGMGIEPQYADKIFRLFDKLDKNSAGSGLGLALVKRIVELNGGQIWMESAGIGHGSCFYFTLPDSGNHPEL